MLTADTNASLAKTDASSKDLTPTARSQQLVSDADALYAKAKGLSGQDALDAFSQAEQKYRAAIDDMKQTADVMSAKSLAQTAKTAADAVGAAQFGGSSYSDASSKLASASAALDGAQYQQAKDLFTAAAAAFSSSADAAKANVQGQAQVAADQANASKQACADAGAASLCPADLAAADKLMTVAQAKLSARAWPDAQAAFVAAKAAYDKVAQTAKTLAADPNRQGAALEQQAMQDVKAKCQALKGKRPDAQNMSWALGEEQLANKSMAASKFADAQKHYNNAKLFYQRALELAK